MKVRFWGTRGSLAKPGPQTIRYGGNTSCIEVRSRSGTLVVIDCGTGAHGLGQRLMSSPDQPKPIRGTLLISHTHWDHIQGIPFFAPLFVPGNEWGLYAPRGLSQSLRETLAGQMQYTYFPVTLEALGATVRYQDLLEGVFEIDDIVVRTRYLSHPALTLGYRLEADGLSVVYACDHEPVSQRAVPTQSDLRGRERRHIDFLAGADLVIHDAQYTAAEYPNRIGWGHSTPDYAAAVCIAAGVGRLALTHHDPNRNDEQVDGIVERLRGELTARGHTLEVFAAAEGETIDLGAVLGQEAAKKQRGFSATTRVDSAIEGHTVLLGPVRPAAAKIIQSALTADHVRLVTERLSEKVLHAVKTMRPSLVILDAATPSQAGATPFTRVRGATGGSPTQVPIVMIADVGDETTGSEDRGSDWLVWPFTEQFARTKIRAWILRVECRWLRARIPDDEESRLAALKALNLLDSAHEERFDRITRIASEAFNVPIALVTLVDRDRQWFKSCVGLGTDQTPRDQAFCSHAILEDEALVVPDTHLDKRFADNPLVTGGPHIRFYAGYPIRSPERFRLGTLCVIDTRPRQLDEGQIELLKNLAALVERELALQSA